MEITLIQGLLLALVAVVFAIDWWLEGLFIFRPIIVCTVVGLILGDLDTGLKCGAIAELSFAGLTAVGGTNPPDPVMAGIMCVVLAKTTGASPAASLALAMPFALLAQYARILFYSIFSFANPKAEKLAKKTDLEGLSKLAFQLTGIVAIAYAVITFLSAYALQEPIIDLVNNMPEWLVHGFEVAGGLIPAVGFAMLLNVMLRSRYMAYLLAGFLFVCYIPMNNILPVALMGLCFALLDYYNNEKKGSVSSGEGI